MSPDEEEEEEEHPAVALGEAAPAEGAPGPTFPGEPPFGAEFFTTVLHDRVRASCEGRGEDVPVVELHLADGTTLDLCHIPTVERLWLAVEAYRDTTTCEEMDLVFVPYEAVTRVTISMWHQGRRPIGFRVAG